MQRIAIPALILSLTALVAWGCSGASTAHNPTSPDTSTTPRGIDAGSGNGSGAPAPQYASPSTNAPSSTGSTRVILTRDCEGNSITIPANPDGKLFQFRLQQGTANNLHDPQSYSWNDGADTGTVQFKAAGWSNVLPLGITGNGGQISFSFTGDGSPDSGAPFSYSTTGTVYYQADQTCSAISSLRLTHQGVGQPVNLITVFGVPLELTHDAYAPAVGEHHSTVASSDGTQWEATVEHVSNTSEGKFVTVWIHADNGSADLRIIWNNRWGIVGIEDPWFSQDAPLLVTFTGYPY